MKDSIEIHRDDFKTFSTTVRIQKQRQTSTLIGMTDTNQSATWNLPAGYKYTVMDLSYFDFSSI